MRTEYRNANEVQKILHDAAQIFEENAPLDDKRLAQRSIRNLFHKEGFHEYPGPVDLPSWDSDTSELFELTSLYSEAKYKIIYAEQPNQHNPEWSKYIIEVQ